MNLFVIVFFRFPPKTKKVFFPVPLNIACWLCELKNNESRWVELLYLTNSTITIIKLVFVSLFSRVIWETETNLIFNQLTNIWFKKKFFSTLAKNMFWWECFQMTFEIINVLWFVYNWLTSRIFVHLFSSCPYRIDILLSKVPIFHTLQLQTSIDFKNILQSTFIRRF